MALKIGHIEDGHRYLGGDPSNQSNWKPVSVAQKVGEFAAGTAIGVAEATNPLQIPRSVETLGKGIGITAGKLSQGEGFSPLKSLSEAAREPMITPDLSLKKIAPVIRAGVKAPFTARTFSQILEDEKFNQEAFQNLPTVGAGQTTGEVGTALLSLGQLGIQAGKKVIDKITKLKGLKVIDQAPELTGLNKAHLQKSKELQRQLLGDLAPEMENALYENTKAVRDLVKGPQEGRSVLSTVETMRNQLQNNKQILGDTIGEFRYAIVSDAPQNFDTSLAIKSLMEFGKQRQLSGGLSILDPKEKTILDGVNKLLLNPKNGSGSANITTRDATLIVDKIDDFLTKQGFYEGKNVTKTNQYLLELRNSIDEELAALYPAYKEVKGRYGDFIKDYQAIQNKIEGLGAESFSANLFGRNKTETRELVERLMDKGDETAKAFKAALNDSMNFNPDNKKYNKVLTSLASKTKDIKFQSGKDLMNEIANKAMARKLSEISDKDADVLRNLINQFIQSKVETADKSVKTLETIAGGFGGTIGTWLGFKMGGPQSALIGGAAGGFGASKTAGTLKRIMQGDVRGKALKEAEHLYSIDRLLDEVSKIKSIHSETSKLVRAAQWISRKFGPEAAEAFLNKIKLTSDYKNDFQKGIAALAGPQGFLRSVTEMEFEGSEIRPSKKFLEERGKK